MRIAGFSAAVAPVVTSLMTVAANSSAGRLSEVGLTVNRDKCEFRLSRLTFFGHELTSDGINPSEEKIAAIRDARSPKDASEVRSFMGLVQYSAKFMPDVASVAKPIQELTRKGIVFHWGKKQQTVFDELKRLITQAETLAYFKVDANHC